MDHASQSEQITPFSQSKKVASIGIIPLLFFLPWGWTGSSRAGFELYTQKPFSLLSFPISGAVGVCQQEPPYL